MSHRNYYSSSSASYSSSDEDSRSRSRSRTRSRSPVVTKKEPENVFKNDGSFLETFRKMQEAAAVKSTNIECPSVSVNPVKSDKNLTSEDTHAEQSTKSNLINVAKRRGGRKLPTGVVKRTKADEKDGQGGKKDAWSQYLEEVRQYREKSCHEDGKSRPLVK